MTMTVGSTPAPCPGIGRSGVPTPGRGGPRPGPVGTIRSVLTVVAGLYLLVVGVLALPVAAGPVLGWDVQVAPRSVPPAGLRAGDVVLIDRGSGVGARPVLGSVDRGGTIVVGLLHPAGGGRVWLVDGGRQPAMGPTLPQSSITGTARLTVPALGRPVHAWRSGSRPAAALAAGSTLAAVALVVSGLSSSGAGRARSGR